MKKDKPKVVVIIPGYNVEKMIKRVVDELPKNLISEAILVDDNSQDNTAKVAKSLGLSVFTHTNNLGYGGSQKTGYWEALKRKPDVVAMLHGDYQHDGTFLDKLIEPVVSGEYDMMFGSRVSSYRNSLSAGMPFYKHIVNRFYSSSENLLLGVNFAEHFSGFRAYSRKVLETVPYRRFSNDYVFDQEFMISALALGFKVGEIAIPLRYPKDASSISLLKGVKSIWDINITLLKYILFKTNIYVDPIFKK